MSDLDAEIEAEILECERLEAIAETEAERRRQLDEQDEAYTEWADVAVKTGVPIDYKRRR